ncbi:MAG: glycosyltransferase [Lentisphaerae bacterium]|nr:glycosyltransferase [Lentisphaerota bacterium]
MTVIVPCRRIDDLVRRCVAGCLRCVPAPRISVVPDAPDSDWEAPPGLSVLPLGDVTIAAKRNAAVRQAETPLVAFIDSDAYPEPDWLSFAVAALDGDATIGAVGGPCIPDDDGSRSRRYVANALRSALVSGPKALGMGRRSAVPGPGAFSSCNLVVRRDVFLSVGGMNEALATGEDEEFCTRLRQRGSKLAFVSGCVVHHRTRSLKGFFWQRAIWGMDALQDLGRNPSPGAVLMILPAAFILFAFAGAVLYLVPSWGMLHAAAMMGYLFVVLAEGIRCARRAAEIPGTVLAVVTGNLAGGMGALLRAAGVRPKHEKYYRHD